MNKILIDKCDILLTEFWPGGLSQFGTPPEIFFDSLKNLNFEIYDLNELTESIDRISIDKLMNMNRLETNLLCIKQ